MSLKLYKNFLSETLIGRLEELASEESDLTGELALMRSVVVDASQMYDTALRSGTGSSIATAGLLLRDAIKDLVDSADKILRLKNRNIVSLDFVKNMLRGVMNVIEVTLQSEHPELLGQIQLRIQQEIETIGHEYCKQIQQQLNRTGDSESADRIAADFEDRLSRILQLAKSVGAETDIIDSIEGTACFTSEKPVSNRAIRKTTD